MISRLVALTAMLLMSAAAFSQEITIAAAADLTYAVHELGDRFHAKTGRSIKVILGSSGNFYSQIQNGAPFDVFMSADLEYPRKLETDGLTEPGSIYQYAVGRLVMWVPKSSTLDVNKGMPILQQPSVRKIAIANPAHAPYGRAAVAAMANLKVYEAAKGKLVLGENVSQAAQFADSGAAEVGIIALSLAKAPTVVGRGRYWEIPLDAYPRIEQGIAILKNSKQKDTARLFLDFIRSVEGREILKRYGFFMPEK